MLDGIILKTEQYVSNVEFNAKAFWIVFGVIFSITLLLSIVILHFENNLTRNEKIGFTFLVVFCTQLFGSLFNYCLCASQAAGIKEYSNQYYIAVSDYTAEMSDDYYIYKQDGNILVLREKGK